MPSVNAPTAKAAVKYGDFTDARSAARAVPSARSRKGDPMKLHAIRRAKRHTLRRSGAPPSNDGRRPQRFGQRAVMLATAAAVTAAITASTASAAKPATWPVVHELATFAATGCSGGCGSGSTIGPDRALYVTDGPGGRVLRVDSRTGAITTFASGLPRGIPAVGIGGAMDVAFRGGTAYVLVTLVGPEFGQPDVISGIYRIERDGSATAIADVGAWSIAHPPATDFFVASGVQYALHPFRGGFLVSDGHHNRVLRVARHGDIRPLIAFGNIVPTGLDVRGNEIYMGEAGPIPHRPEDGKVVRFTPGSPAREVASGGRLIVDVEFGRGRQLYALSQGIWDLPPTPENEGKPASPDTGSLLRVNGHGGLESVVDGLDRPTSVELIGDTAYVVTLTGKVIRIDGVSWPPLESGPGNQVDA
jgi:sugar lactone lactonase YvrE